MAKEFFKDLPNTTTPLTATRLNGLLDGDEALGNLVVDSIRTKNMLDIYNWEYGWISNTGTLEPGNTNARFEYIQVNPNTTYTLSSFSALYSAGIVEYNSNKTFISRSTSSYVSSKTITTSSTTRYIRLFINKDNSSTITLSAIKSLNLQFEKGNSATTYMAYQNLNGYNNFSLGEMLIGTWIDGKELYRSVYTISSPQSSNTDYIDLTSLNIDKVVNLYGFYTTNSGTFDIPFYDSSTNYCVMFYSPSKKIRGRFGAPTVVTDAKVIIEYTKN